MHVITPTEENVIGTAAAEMTGLAAPSRGSVELSTWKVRIEPGVAGPAHTIDREQIWMFTSGAAEVNSQDRTEKVAAGQTLVLPAGAVRSIRGLDDGAEALVAMAAGGRAALAGSEESRPVPWAR